MSGELPEIDEAAFEALADDLLRVARHLGPGYGLDVVSALMALSYAATKGLFELSSAQGMPEETLGIVQIMNDTAMRSAADMVAGEDSHQTSQ